MKPDRWLMLSLEVPPAMDPSALAEGLLRLGGTAVEERAGRLITCLPNITDPHGAVLIAEAALRVATGAGGLSLSWRLQAQEDWSEIWKRDLHSLRITERIIVKPSWDPVETGPEEVVLVIDPGMAFGTAHHPTTRGCLRLLDGLARTGHRVADVGAGSGILAIAAAKLGASEVLAVEMDPYACEVALDNIRENAVEDLVRIIPERATPELIERLGPLDGCVANIESRTLMSLMPGLGRGLRRSGWLVLGGILAPQAGAVSASAARVGLRLFARDKEEEWWSGGFRHVGPLSGGVQPESETLLLPDQLDPASHRGD